MTDAELRSLVESIAVPGWTIRVAVREVTVEPAVPPVDVRVPSRRLSSFGESFTVAEVWERELVVRRVFAVLQFRTDHELREQFLVDGIRYFDAHEPSVTGLQHDWFVEAESAVRGY